MNFLELATSSEKQTQNDAIAVMETKDLSIDTTGIPEKYSLFKFTLSICVKSK